jgi:hypothetical protein
MRARVLTPWINTAGGLAPQLATAYTLQSWVDVTGQAASQIIPTPNALTVEIVCDPATLATITADATYTVLWSESA